MIRAVLDTNLFVSSVVCPGGIPDRILDQWKNGGFRVIVSEPLFREITEVLTRPKILAASRVTAEETVRIMKHLGQFTESVEIEAPLSPDDPFGP